MVGKSRIDIIGQNGNTGEHYEDTYWAEEEVESMPNGRWNWYGEGEDQPVWKKDSKVGPCSAHAHQQDRWALEDQKMEALKKMQRYSGYNAKFWIFEEQRYGTWEESQEFYSRQAEEEKRIRATSFANSLSTEELAAVRDRLVAEG